jgi:hypothetical protein
MNDTLPPGSLDMEVSPEEKFAPNKMRSHRRCALLGRRKMGMIIYGVQRCRDLPSG